MSSPTASRRTMPLWLIILSAGAIAGIATGVRNSLGLYLKPMTEELKIGREAFGFAMALANLVWGLGAPFTGAISDKKGTGYVVVGGVLTTIGGLYLMYAATSALHLAIGGVLLGVGIAGTGVTTLVGAVGRMAPPEKRVSAMSMVSMGSGIGILVCLPYTHLIIELVGWKTSILVLAATTLIMIVLAIPVSGTPPPPAGGAKPQTLKEALAEALSHPSFWLLIAGFFVCGYHVMFVAVHLPAFIADKGLPTWVGPAALTCVGIGNIIGTYLAGVSARFIPKRIGLSCIYFMRSIVFLGFLYLPMTETTVILLAGALGLFWLSTIPLTSGLVATFFGPVWMSMLYGIVFLSHQIGSFLGVWMGGRVFDALQSYDLMWWISVALGILAALVHLPIKEMGVPRLLKPTPAPVPASAAAST